MPRKPTIPTSKPSPKETPKELSLINPPPSPLPTPSLHSSTLRFSYTISRGETGVLTFEPYKSLILPYWRFRTVAVAQSSAEVLWGFFESYRERGDFVGMDMCRKFVQMGMTRARRYANHKGGRKYDREGGVLPKWEGTKGEGARREKEQASEVFKEVWQRCRADETYKRLREEWEKEKVTWKKRERNNSEEES